jgi:hypothetical protein
LLALGALLGSDCVGTPLPEPPDELPRPEFGAIEHAPVIDTAAGGGPPAVREAKTVIQSHNGGVPPGARVWAINLDRPGGAAVETSADALGGFALELLASDQQRVRVIARTDRQHSAPLDLLVSVSKSDPPVSGVAELRNTGLACLQLMPPETLVMTGKQGSLTLINQCETSVQITRAELRLGDQGIALGTVPPGNVAPGAPLTLTLTDGQGPSSRERLDILLLDVGTPAGLTGRYAVDVFSALK